MTYTEIETEKSGMMKYHADKKMTEENYNWTCIRKIYTEIDGRMKKQWILHHEEYGVLLQEDTEKELLRTMMWYTINTAEKQGGYL